MKSKMYEFQKKIKTSSKTNFFLLLAIFFIAASSCGCTKDAGKGDPIFALPPETQVGANTFGVTINGKVYVPRDPTGTNYGGVTTKGMFLTGLYISGYNYTEVVVQDGASSVAFNLIIHLENLNMAKDYVLKQSNFQDQVDSISENHIFFKIWDSNISNYAYYGSIENQGVVKVSKLSGGIFAGVFSGKFVRSDNPNDFIQITDGRFDIGPGLYSKIFP